MNYKSPFLLVLLAAVLVTSACKKDDDTKKEYDVPTSYNFDNVDYSGQQTRIAMLDEMKTYIMSANAMNASALDAQTLKNQYANTNNAFLNSELSNSDKNLKGKTFGGVDTKVENYLDALATVSAETDQTAADGQAGIAMTNNSQSFLLNANGVDLGVLTTELIAGAVLYYQASAVYLGDGKMNVDNQLVTDGKGTTMEHHWDESFGYFGAEKDGPTQTNTATWWAAKSNMTNAQTGLNSTIMDAYLKGRAAISNDDMEARDEAITTLKNSWEELVAATAIHYLNAAKSNWTTDAALAHHYLSMAYANIMNLQYGAERSVSDVETILTTLAGSSNALQADFYAVTAAKITAAVDAIAANFSELESKKDAL